MTPFSLPPYIPHAGEGFRPGKDLVHYSGPVWGTPEIEAAVSSLRTGRWISAGEKVAAFERQFSKDFGHAASVMVNSGSSANLIMLSAAKRYFGWQDGDEIIVSVVGFPTTVAPIIQCGLKPVFVDIELETLNWDHDKFLCGNKTKALMVSPVLGNPPDMDFLDFVCEKYDLKLLLDGCDSLGSKWGEAPISDYADATSCSFYAAHHICTGEGGMVSSGDADFIRLARKFAHWGRDCHCVGAANALPKGSCGNRFAAHLGPDVGVVDHKYVFSEIGFNLKPLDLQGAIGLEQLKRFPGIRAARRRIYSRLSAVIRKAGHTVPAELPEAETCWFGIPVICPDAASKQSLVSRLEAARIQTRNYFAGNLLLHPGYSHLGTAGDYPNANRSPCPSLLPRLSSPVV